MIQHLFNLNISASPDCTSLIVCMVHSVTFTFLKMYHHRLHAMNTKVKFRGHLIISGALEQKCEYGFLFLFDFSYFSLECAEFLKECCPVTLSYD